LLRAQRRDGLFETKPDPFSGVLQAHPFFRVQVGTHQREEVLAFKLKQVAAALG
jgi:hypothetical protein